MTQLLKKWEYATQELTDKFIRKYFGKDAEAWWVGDEIGGVLAVNDYFFGLDRIVGAMRFKATFEQLSDYHELEMEKIENGKDLANFENYVKHGMEWA